MSVTAATFKVHRIGTAVINAIDESGRSVRLHMHNTLISERFPFKLLALQLFTTKGCEVIMGEQNMRIVNPVSDTVLIGLKDATTKLFFLQESPSTTSSPVALLARSYGSGTSDLDQLWKLHLRHGHRNFADLSRQYNLPLPKPIPACTSCIMAKSHVQPHLSTGFERATRVAEGFHSDFRGPFSVSLTITPAVFSHFWQSLKLSGWKLGKSS